MVQIPITHKLSYLICGTLAVPAASTDCVKGRCNRDIPTIDVSSYPHALQIFLHSVTRLKKHKKNILDISVRLLPAMALLLSYSSSFSPSSIDCPHVWASVTFQGREQRNLVTLFRRQTAPCSRFDSVTSSIVLFSSYRTWRAEAPSSSLLYLL